MKPRVTLCAIVFLAAGCATTWTVRSTPSAIALQWPFQPAKPKLTFVASLDGFSQRQGSGDALRAFVYGRDRTQRGGFVLPVAVARGGDGRIAVADLGRRCVDLYIPAEKRYVQITGGKKDVLVSPVGVVFDEAFRLYVSDSSGKVFGFDAQGVFRFAVTRAAADPFLRPTGLAYSPTKKLVYVVDTLANRVHALDTNGSGVFSFGRRGDEAGGFNYPTHIFRSSAGELYVANTLAFRIEIFDEDGNARGSFGRHGDGSGDLAMPKGIAVDKDGVVYLVDGLFDNVQLFNRQGDFLLTLGRRGTEAGEFWLPSGAFIGDNGELYVCDTYNRRVQVFRITERYESSS
jgi:DNA-binding beta-propeller fold protein YncE